LKAAEGARERACKKAGGGSRATYHRFKAEFLEQRGEFDVDEALAIRLHPPTHDPYSLEQIERRKQLEELREELEIQRERQGKEQPDDDLEGDENVADKILGPGVLRFVAA